MVGLAQTTASTASLLLSLEGVATALIAWFIFHENFDYRVMLGMACLVVGAMVLSWSGQPTGDIASCPADNVFEGQGASCAQSTVLMC
jgi:drug/metabolite transporter (DMT)-like permease